MGVLQVVRTSQQDLAAVQMSMDDAGRIMDLLAKVSSNDPNNYTTESLTGAAFAEQGGWRIKFSRADHPDQFAYQGDWILVTNATYSDDAGWTIAATSEVLVYGVSTGLPGTADDFTNTFAPVTG